MALPADPVYVAYAVGDVVAIGPHPVKGKILDGSALAHWLAFSQHMHLD
jgi:hypothetical protein